MTRSEFHREGVRSTGEDFATISRRGFVQLTFGPVERDYEEDRLPETFDRDSESHEVRTTKFDGLFCLGTQRPS
jgi:hypothetical protein